MSKITQQAFAKHVGITRQAVGDFVQRGILDLSAGIDVCRLAYCHHMREMAAGRASDDGSLDLVTERARLASEQADNMSLKNAVSRREVAPVLVLEASLAHMSEQIGSMLDSIPLRIKKRSPKLTARDIEDIRSEIAKVRNAASSATLDYSKLEVIA